MTYFTNINTLEELKKAYRKLAAKLHPDNGGTKEEMQALNAEYEAIFARVKNIHTTSDGKTYTKETTETAEMFRNVIEKIINLNVNIDICGSWVWVYGDTYKVKNELKAAGLAWASRKKMWYWHAPEDVPMHHKKSGFEYAEIKRMHGCETVKKSTQQKYIATA